VLGITFFKIKFDNTIVLGYNLVMDSNNTNQNEANKMKKTNKLFDNVTGGLTMHRLYAFISATSGLSDAEMSRVRIEECSDEKTGVRYGRAKCRAGRCAKLGSGGRNKGSRRAYQVWAVWS